MSESSQNILAIETSGYEGSIALAMGDTIEARSLAAEGRRNAQTMVVEVDQLLKDHRLAPVDIDAVAVSIGPGSFTGLRVGVVFAKTFCWANKAKLIAVDTLQALAQRISPSKRRVTVISDAQRNELFINEYEWDRVAECRRPVGKVRIETLDEIKEASTEETDLLTGPGLEKHSAALLELRPVTAAELWKPTAETVAAVGRVMLNEQQLANMYTVEPLYIRRSYAEEKSAK